MQPTPHISKEWWPREILTTRQKENQLIGENMQELADKENCIRKTDMTARLEAEGGFFRYATSGESGGIALKTSDRRLANQPDISPLDVEKLLVLYRACVQNAGDLLIESILLAKYAKYHRATFLVITAFEEMGKAQLVADYADNAISAREFKKAFGDHSFKIAYMNRFISLHAAGPLRPKLNSEATITFDYRPAEYLVPLREQSLYVQWRHTFDNLILPAQVTKTDFDEVFERVQDFFEEIDHPEWLNGRIGSRALFK